MTIQQILAFHSDELFGRKFIVHHINRGWHDDQDELMIVERDGLAVAGIYWYLDDKTTVYLYMLSVSDEARKNRLGTRLQEIRETIGTYLGATYARLFVNKDTWMQDWYKRRGYVEFENRAEPDENIVWMVKELTKSKTI